MLRLTTLALTTLAVHAANPVRISCIGDSITVGVCSNNGMNYPNILQTLLGPSYLVSNFGSSGHTMLKNGLCGPPPAGNCSYWGTPEWTNAQTSTPDIVTIMLGTNDAKNFNWFNATCGNYTGDYLDMINIVQNLPSKPKVFVITPPPLYPPFPYDMNETVINEIFPVLLRQIATIGNTDGVIDVFNALGGAGLTQPGITCDGCHPVNPGYLEAAQTIFVDLVNYIKASNLPEPVYTPGLSYPENYALEERQHGLREPGSFRN